MTGGYPRPDAKTNLARRKQKTGDPRNAEEESRRILARTQREATGLFGSSLAQLHRSGKARQNDEDAIELWGRRIGRILAVLAVIILLIVFFV